MKITFSLRQNLRLIITYFDLFRFSLQRFFLGFDSANNFLRRVDKTSIKLILIRNGAKIGKNCDIETGLIFHNCKDYKNLIIGNNCHIGKNCFFDLRDRIVIGNNVVISMQCTFITHTDMNKSTLSEKFPAIQDEIIIRDNCYIGSNVTILQGIKMNINSIIAAGALVNTDIIENQVVAGVPAKEIKKINGT